MNLQILNQIAYISLKINQNNKAIFFSLQYMIISKNIQDKQICMYLWKTIRHFDRHKQIVKCRVILNEWLEQHQLQRSTANVMKCESWNPLIINNLNDQKVLKSITGLQPKGKKLLHYKRNRAAVIPANKTLITRQIQHGGT